MNQEEARKILGMREGDTDILSNFARRKKLFTNRLDAAPNERLREQYQDMINQLEQAAAVLALVEQQYSGQVTPEQPGILQDNTNANTVTADHTPLGIIELSPGQILSDRYEIKQQIGKDDIGVLLRVFDQVRKREVAIKVIYPELLSDETVKQNFLTEINRASELYHPGIMNIAGIGNDGDYHFLIMELLRGRTLRRMMNSRKKNRKPFSLNEIIHIVSSLAKALNYARIKTAHGDLRPGNIWVDEKGTCKIMGYGTNRLLRISKSVQTGGEVISAYMAPEQLEASPHTDERSDMFALGIILFELFTFKTPKRKGETVKIGHRKVSKPTAAILRKMLAFDPANRFDSPEQVSIALTDIETATQKPLASPRFIILAGAVFVSAYLAISSGLPSRVTELWQEYLPVSEETKQQQFNTAIGHVNEVNSLIRQLEQLRQKLTSRIRDISLSIAASNNRLTKTRNEDIQNEIRQQIRQAQTDRSRLLDIQSLTQQVIYEKGQLLSAKADVIKALALIDNNSFLDASDLLQPVREQLKLDLVRFGQSSVYFNTQDSLNAAEAEWRAFRQAMQLKIPERDLGKQIETAESFVDQGRLAEAIAHLEKLTQVFKNTLEADRQRVEDRRQYQVQRGRTEKLEREWLSYLRQNGLRVSETQTKEIQRLKSSQSESLAQENFKAAETSSLALSDNLTSYLSASREEIQNKISRQQAENERRKQEQLARARAEADKALAEKNLKQPTKEREEVIEQAPSDTQVKQQIKEADSLSSLQLLARFAPNLKLVQIPAGTFRMGALNRGGSSDEKPVHRVNLESFNMSRHEITFEQYDVYAELTGADRPDDEGWGRGDNPVINVSWNDATAYTAWLSEKTGLRFRLPSEAEWEYAARAGSSSKFPWGDDTTHENANYGKEICCGGEASGRDQWVNTSPVGAFPENNFGLQDMHGNVSEWVQDCRSDSYNGAPQDGSAFEFGDCDWRMLRGGSWSSIADYLRSANRDSNRIVKRNNSLGFRILQEL